MAGGPLFYNHFYAYIKKVCVGKINNNFIDIISAHMHYFIINHDNVWMVYIANFIQRNNTTLTAFDKVIGSQGFQLIA